MSKKSLRKRLGMMQDNWEVAKDKGPQEFPNGTFKFQLQNAEVVESQNTNKLQIHLEHLCLEGEPRGKVLHSYLQLEGEWGPVFVQQWISKMGREVPDSMSDVEEVVAEINEAAPIYMGRVKTTDDGFTNVTITRLVAGEAEKADEDGEPATEEEDDEDEDDDEEEEDDDDDDEDDDDEDEDEDDDDDDDEDEDEDDDDDDDEEEEEDDEEEDTWTSDEVLDMNKSDVDAMIKGLKLEKKIKATKLEEKRFALVKELKKLGRLVEDEEEDDEEDDGDDERTDLIALLQAHDVDVDDDDSLASLKKKAKKIKWDAGELIDEEVELLESIGATVEKKAKKEKPAAKKGRVKREKPAAKKASKRKSRK